MYRWLSPYFELPAIASVVALSAKPPAPWSMPRIDHNGTFARRHVNRRFRCLRLESVKDQHPKMFPLPTTLKARHPAARSSTETKLKRQSRLLPSSVRAHVPAPIFAG
ncbi:hypothetical protein [Piscinibacter sakaiensis]|uniref:hypothetical protein n=1 Tax=Piscinibacter sakaiensis TaxID=1547922 RepID=UPI003AAAB1F0